MTFQVAEREGDRTSKADPAARPRAAHVPGFTRLGDLVSGSLPGGPARDDVERRIADLWSTTVGPDAARNSQPRHLRKGRLVVATSSAAWAQALQDQGDGVIDRLNDALGEEAIRSVRFAPAGWDPCAGRDAPTALGSDPTYRGPGSYEPLGADAAAVRGGPPPKRRLTDAEEQAVEEVRSSASDPKLGDLIAGAMRAALERKAGAE